MNISSENSWPAKSLSNFTGHRFIFDGIECGSMEGLLQSFKFKDVNIQKEVCKLVGLGAKRRGSKRNKAWKSVQKLWWAGVEFDRHGKEYQDLLDRAYEALFLNDKFQKALLATGNSVLTHTIGKNSKSDTVLTVSEFCSRLMALRRRL